MPGNLYGEEVTDSIRAERSIDVFYETFRRSALKFGTIMNSHQPLRQRERRMKRFKSPGSACLTLGAD